MGQDWELHQGHGPIVATALHAGTELSAPYAAATALSYDERRREEDPYTDSWTVLAPTRIAVRRSRFEVDLNRPREGCVYWSADHAWGMNLWRFELSDELVAASLRRHDAFYAMLERVLRTIAEQYGSFVVYDLHSYNHRRGGPLAPPEDSAANPEINLGTGSLDRGRWGHIADRFMDDLASQYVDGRRLDVRENVRFQGGYMSQWIHDTFPETGCALAIEVKKTFMDEHTGAVDRRRHAELGRALAATVPGILFDLRHQRVH